MPMGTYVVAATVLCTFLGVVARKGQGMMALLVSYLWLCITTSLTVFIRHEREEESHKHGGSISARPLVPTAKVGKPEERKEEDDGEEREMPVFQFKFSFQIPEQSNGNREVQTGSSGEDAGSFMVTSISSYRFFSERDHRGFVEAPQAMTLRVQEAYIDSDGAVQSSTEDLDREPKSRLSSVKHSCEADADARASEELDRELKNRLLSVNLSRRYNLDAGADIDEKAHGLKSFNLDSLSTAILSEELELLDDIRVLDGAAMTAGNRFPPSPAGDIYGFDSDSDMESKSDGYSVKDLILDVDSDGFFSEKDYGSEVDRERFSGLDGEEACVGFEQKNKATQWHRSLDSMGISEDFNREGTELTENTKDSCIELKPESLSNSLSYSDSRDIVVSNGIIQSSTVELDSELKSRFSLVKSSGPAASKIAVAEELDRELKCRLSSVKLSRPYDLDVGIAVHGEEQERRLSHDNLRRADDAFEELEHLDTDMLDEAHAPAGDRLFRVPAGDVGVSDSDSHSESRSDGYSVKDLILDFDSDVLFSEEDFDADAENRVSLDLDGVNENFSDFNEKSRAIQLPDSLHHVGGSKCLHGERLELMEDAKNCIEAKPEGQPRSVCSSVHHVDVVSDRYLHAAELKSEQLHQEELDQKEAVMLVNHSCPTNELSSTTSHVGLDTEHLLKVHFERIPPEVGQEGIDKLGLEALESLESLDCGTKNRNMKNYSALSSQVLSEEETVTSSPKSKHLSGEETGDVAETGENPDEREQGSESPQDSAETHWAQKTEKLSTEDEEELESLWEHDDLIDQLKMDLRRARASGLPTILEESESPRPGEGLKPWKPEVREDPMEELHKFYKSYRERMRKFDVLNNQKMYAIGFLQLKDPVPSVGTKKPILPTIASVLSQSFWRRKPSTDPSEKFIKELQSDLETVYVGQSCLSWEFLLWQYERTHGLLGSDRHDSRQYNQVTEEFQQFHVLIQRFLEDEPFQGPRIPNYAKNRCFLRRLLQVPVIREDSFKDKADERRQRKDAVTGEQLEYSMEDSIRVFWEFVKSDKDEAPLIMKGLFGTHVELQDPTDLEFWADIQATLKQKRKKLKDVLRTGNCLVKKFRRPRQGRSNQDDLFFSQVDLQLVSRVLKMRRITTDQLVWCDKKLSKISFVDRKLLREPSFLLFPY